MTQISKERLEKPFEAKCFYVQEPTRKWWAYFTITSELGLLQIFGDFGTFSESFADRWSAPGDSFERFLIQGGAGYVSNCLERTAAHYNDRASTKDRNNIQRRIGQIMLHLWPLFIEKLKAELQEPPCNT